MPFHIAGHWQDGASSVSLPALIKVTEDRLELWIENKAPIALTPNDISVSARIGNTPRYIQCNKLTGQLESMDHEHIDRLSSLSARGFSHYIHYVEQHLLMVAIATITVLCLGIGYFTWGIPAGSKLLAEQLPKNLLQQASDETLYLLEKRYLEPSKLDPEKQQQIKELIRKNSPDFDLNKFYIRDGAELGANAFALPDGSIIFTDQIIKLAGDSDAQLLGVFGHELGHVHHRHALRHILQNSAIALTIALVGGDVSSLGDIVLTLPVVFSQLSFSRKFELESDRYGANYLQERGYERSSLATMLQKLHASHGRDCATATDEIECKTDEALYKYLSTHPHLEDRIKAIASPH